MTEDDEVITDLRPATLEPLRQPRTAGPVYLRDFGDVMQQAEMDGFTDLWSEEPAAPVDAPVQVPAPLTRARRRGRADPLAN
ncbi:hypothetical protein [Melissospora conviva]|uniref:hypothetical protein n=1 Tax=Melissospora conviva TaxID=3388432 RepID=UPI003C1B173B